MNVSIKLLFIAQILFFTHCKVTENELPFLGETIVENGLKVHHKVGQFSHYNQDSMLVNNQQMSSNIYIADFFFTSCPSICPRVMKEMLKIHKAFENESMVKLISFTIDPKRDNVFKLKLYADKLGISSKNWYFLTGDKDKTLELANTFFVAALEDENAPGGFDHSGKILLIDKEGHVRSFSEGTDPENTPKFIDDVNQLLAYYKKEAK